LVNIKLIGNVDEGGQLSNDAHVCQNAAQLLLSDEFNQDEMNRN